MSDYSVLQDTKDINLFRSQNLHFAKKQVQRRPGRVTRGTSQPANPEVPDSLINGPILKVVLTGEIDVVKFSLGKSFLQNNQRDFKLLVCSKTC